MGEHLVCNQAVVGSTPVASTRGRMTLESTWRSKHNERPSTNRQLCLAERPFFDIQGKLENDVANYEYKRRAWLSYEGFMVDALASRADEGRGIAAKSLGEPLSRL